MITPGRKWKLYWLCQFSAWGLYAVLNGLLINSYSRLSWQSNLGVLSYGLCGIAVTHALRAWIHRAALVSRPWTTILRHMALMIPIGAFTLTAMMMCVWWLSTGSSMDYSRVNLISLTAGILFNMSFLMLIWLLIYFTVHTVWRSLALRDAQLTALQAQINPHFLFNSLNSLRGLILENPTAAQDAVTRLSQLMRYSLSQSRRPTVPLHEELDAIRDYLAIEKIRFEDRLQVNWHIDPGVHDLPVPPMCLQTLVENALKHGIANLPGGGAVHIEANHSGNFLTLKVTNPGSLTSNSSFGAGSGLENIRQRLQLLNGPRATLHLSESDGLVQAIITLPTP